MPLSPGDRAVLNEIDREITEQDPDFAHGLADGLPHAPREYSLSGLWWLAISGLLAVACGAAFIMSRNLLLMGTLMLAAMSTTASAVINMAEGRRRLRRVRADRR